MKNARTVLNKVNEYLNILETTTKASYATLEVYDDLSIFDWWVERIRKSHLKDMKKFLQEAIKLGYTGYVCFKVGASGCANGMWAYKEESTTGYSPEGEFLYKSFTPAYEYWSVKIGEEILPERENFDIIKTIKQLEEFIIENR